MEYYSLNIEDIEYLDDDEGLCVERWGEIDGFGRYMISDLGRVKRLGGNRSKDKILKPLKTKAGYLRIFLYLNGVKRAYPIHRLVGVRFVPNPLGKPQINHKKGIKVDNRATEIEWATSSENIKHSFQVLGQLPNKSGTGKFNELNSQSKKIVCETTGKEYPSIKEVVRQTGLQQASITRVCIGAQSKTKGLVFKYM